MKLKELLDIDLDITVTGVTDDSREVKEGTLFVATKGFNVDHYDYIGDAIKKGCSFVVADREIQEDFPHTIVDHIEDVYQELCCKFYGISFDDFHFIGVTGTDGKTSTTTIIKNIMEDCAYIGTIGVEVGSDTYTTHNTTPCINELCENLGKIKNHGVHTVSMEVSSEALLHDRVSHITYDIIGFTNITGDHLNVHGTFEEYVKCKMKLLDLVKDDGVILVNGDDPILKTIDRDGVHTFGFDSTNEFVITNVDYQKRGTDITINNSIHLHSPYIGKYNVYNVVLAYLVGHYSGIEDKVLTERISHLKPIPGRCEFLDFGQDFDIVLDYAHTINGIHTILDTFQNQGYSQVIALTGAAGGREHEKRPIIGRNVIEKSDIAIFTMDDPRYEDVNEIIDQLAGDSKDYIRIPDRVEAIHYAFDIAEPGSVVLILGKGRDNYMAIEDRKEPYNDYDVIERYFKEKS